MTAGEGSATPGRLTQPDKKGKVLIETGKAVRTQLMKCAKVNELVAAVRKLQPDELADILKQMPAKAVAALFADMDSERRHRLETLQGYPDHTAGGLPMRTMRVPPCTSPRNRFCGRWEQTPATGVVRKSRRACIRAPLTIDGEGLSSGGICSNLR
ncbi:MAG: magnesium transporter MgtE N-terminal domain-containing protein [Gammaproteobacteria bacterium]